MKSLLLVSAFFISISSISQEAGSGKLKKANEQFESFSFNTAIDKYEKIDLSEMEAQRNLAMSYWKSNQLKKADSIYQMIMVSEGHNAMDMYNSAQVLRQNKDYTASDELMLAFSENAPTDSRGRDYSQNKGYYSTLLENKNQFVIKNLEINSEQQDFGTSYYVDQIVFASSREKNKAIYRRWNWNQLPFLDIYTAESQDLSELQNLALFDKKVNKKFHEGPVTFNQDGTKMIFTRNNYSEKALDKEIRLKLFYAEKDTMDGTWKEAVPLPFNSPDYSVGHASISSDEKWVYFASNMPGGFGGVDIYKVSLSEDGTFGNPVNLGDAVNTEGNEMFPFIHEGNEMLFYSSDGKYGLGGLDVFVTQIKPDQTLGKTLNVGTPINSNRDDFAFIVDQQQKTGYFSSNREGGKGDDDIYSFAMLKPFGFGNQMLGSFVDIDGNIINGFEFKILDSQNNVVLEGITEDDLDFVLDLDKEEDYKIEATKEGYFDFKANFDESYAEERDFNVAFDVTKDPGISLYTYIYDGSTKKPIENAEIIIEDKATGSIKTFNTSDNGDHTQPLMDTRIGDTGNYNITINKEGYLSVTGDIEIAFDREGQYNISEYMNIELESIKIGGDLSDIIDINPIYFDLNKYNIRPDAAIELDKIVKVMNENPTMVIELGSHTDSRGSDASNRSLSDRRAKASAQYIAERITNPERIYGKGYGESTPNTVDASEDGGSESQLLTEDFINAFKSKNRKLFDKYHQYNRRTEFIIVKM